MIEIIRKMPGLVREGREQRQKRGCEGRRKFKEK